MWVAMYKVGKIIKYGFLRLLFRMFLSHWILAPAKFHDYVYILNTISRFQADKNHAVY